MSPRNPYAAHGACSWESRVFATSVTPRFGRLCPSVSDVQHAFEMPLVFFAFSRVPRLARLTTLDRYFPSGPPLDPLGAVRARLLV
eukprot:1192549-Prorocentrum_minimum.AAC.2